MKTHRICFFIVCVFWTVNCSNQKFHLAPDTQIFRQAGNAENRKVDVLWVIDNSASMETSQQNLADNFDFFIDKFIQKNVDFQMAITTTDAYKAIFSGDPQMSKFKGGIMSRNTPNLKPVFLTNVLQGTAGAGDERAFSSFREALDNSLNAGFVRPGGILAIIVVSDEDDFSHSTAESISGNYNFPGLHTVQSYVDYLMAKTGSSGSDVNFKVHTIGVLDEPCRQKLLAAGGTQQIGIRYIGLSDATKGAKTSVCGDFGTNLSLISNDIITLVSRFHLSREPHPETITVVVDGVTVPNNETNGWTYDSATVSVDFHGDAIPPEGAVVQIDFVPTSIK